MCSDSFACTELGESLALQYGKAYYIFCVRRPHERRFFRYKVMLVITCALTPGKCHSCCRFLSRLFPFPLCFDSVFAWGFHQLVFTGQFIGNVPLRLSCLPCGAPHKGDSMRPVLHMRPLVPGFAPQKHEALNIIMKKQTCNLVLVDDCKLALHMKIFIFQFIWKRSGLKLLA